MSKSVIRVVGTNEQDITVFDELVGPFTEGKIINEWLRTNGFNPDTMTERKGRSFFHNVGTSGSPLATNVWAQIVNVQEPEKSVVNSDPDTYLDGR